MGEYELGELRGKVDRRGLRGARGDGAGPAVTGEVELEVAGAVGLQVDVAGLPLQTVGVAEHAQRQLVDVLPLPVVEQGCDDAFLAARDAGVVAEAHALLVDVGDREEIGRATCRERVCKYV